jgi:hypothetical protein
MLVFRAQEYIDERALVYDVVETATGIPSACGSAAARKPRRYRRCFEP